MEALVAVAFRRRQKRHGLSQHQARGASRLMTPLQVSNLDALD